MIAHRPYFAGDARLIRLSPHQVVEARYVGGDAEAFARSGVSYTILEDARPVACGGFLKMWDGFAIGWGLAGALSPRASRAVVLATRAAFEKLGPVRRIEATARADFAGAQRLLKHLGFAKTLFLDGYGPDGGDYWLYVWRPS